MQWYNINAEWVNFSFWPCNIDSVYLTVHFTMHSLYLFAFIYLFYYFMKAMYAQVMK